MDRSGLNPTFLETESAVLRDLAAHFERAWTLLPAGSVILDFERFLPPQGTMLRTPALATLVKVDLAQRWRRGQRPTLEEYLQKYPELGTPLTVAPDLVAAEYQVRHQHGDRPALTVYQSRFPMQFPQLQNMVGPLPPGTARDVTATGTTATPPETENDKTVIRSGPPEILEPLSAIPTLGDRPPPRNNFLAAMSGDKDARVLQIGSGYKLLKRIGSGSFGEVWRAEAPGGVLVGIKIILRPLDSEEAQRELQSLELIKKIKHPFLLDTQAFWSLEDRLLIVMELADGSLRDRLKECRAAGLAAMPLGELITIFRESAEALDFLHTQGVQHRDIKPENILLLQRHAKVADFGLARVMQSLHAKSASMSGTPMYMAPEVWQGMLSPHSDQYSLAFTYTELRLGRPVFKSQSLMEVMHRHLEGEHDLAPLVPAEQEVLRRALAKDASQRYGSCLEFMQELINAVRDELRSAADFRLSSGEHDAFMMPSRRVGTGNTTTRPAALATQQAVPPRRGRTAVFLGAGGILAIALTVGLFLFFNRGEGDNTTPPTPPAATVAATIFLPPGCVPGEKAELVPLSSGGKLYNVIDRTLPDGTRVPFRLIADPDSAVRPFYVMENKVTNAQFQQFARAKPQEVTTQEWQQGAMLTGGKRLGIAGKEQFPVFDVTVEDAHRCAQWLGGKLPTTQQWEAAAGYSAKAKGPYRGDPHKFDKDKDVAVDRAALGPLPAGTALKDISPLGVRDTAGNGCEWTRTIFDTNQEVPASGDKGNLFVELRGRSYSQATTPLTYSPGEQVFELCPYLKTRPDISFRVVLELP